MKLNLLIDPYGTIIGVSQKQDHHSSDEKGASDRASPMLGFEPLAGQSVHEVDVPDNFADPSKSDLLQRLEELDVVIEVRRSIPMSGESQGFEEQVFALNAERESQSLTAGPGTKSQATTFGGDSVRPSAGPV